MLKRTLLLVILTLSPVPLFAQSGSAVTGSSGQVSAGGASVSISAAGSPSLDTLGQMIMGVPTGDMTVSDPLSRGPIMMIPVDVDPGMPDLPVQEHCAMQASGAVNVAISYETCMTAETDAYDLIEAGMGRYDVNLISVCVISARLRGGSYIAMLDCLGPAPDN